MCGAGGIYFVLFLFITAAIGHIDRTMTHSSPIRDFTAQSQNGRRGQCNTDQVEYRLEKFEQQMNEKTDHIKSEVREGNKRLQILEYDSEEVRNVLEELRSELGRFLSVHEPARIHERSTNTEKMELEMNSLTQGIQLAIATMRKLNSEIDNFKRDLSSLKNATSTILLRHDNLARKQYLSTTISDMKNEYSHSKPTSWNSYSNTSRIVPKSCKEIFEKDSHSESGIYQIQPENSPEGFFVYCDMTTNGGGWIYIQNRFDGSQDFFQDLQSYKLGFGNLAGEFWLGLEHIYHLTGNKINELLIELVDQTGTKAYAHYAAFSIGQYSQGYPLKILGGYSGDAGDSLTYHAGSKFSTKDLDLDNWNDGSCALAHNGAWWYKQCDRSNLNGLYIKGLPSGEQTYQGMYWNDFGGPQYSLKETRMMIRERNIGSQSIFPKIE